MKKRTICVLLTIFAGLIVIVCFAINSSYYPMGGEVTVISKQANNNKYYITVEQGEPGNAGWGQFELECTPEQYQTVDVGDVIECDRTQSVVTHKGKIHKIHDSAVEEEQTSNELTPIPITLNVADLISAFDTLDLSDAKLTYHGATDETVFAKAAIRAESYMEALKSFTWKEHAPTSEWKENEDYFYRLTTPEATITAFQGGRDAKRPLHLITDDGEGWFILPSIETKDAKQLSWMTYDLFSKWYAESWAASFFRGTGDPLTAEEMDYFQKYTEGTWTAHDAYGEYPDGATEISCFFTSTYDVATELNFEEFMRYFPGDGNSTPVTDAEFEALKTVDGWPFIWVENRENMPVPIHKYSRREVDAVLTKYAGITTADLLDTSGVAYLKNYDAFYNCTSDFGPGMFTPYYGERNNDIVTLWDHPPGHNDSAIMLILKKSGENWHILAHQPAIYHFTAEVVKYGNDALCVKVTDAGDSTLSIGDELYVSVRDGYDNYPIGCSVVVAYSGKVTVYDDGTSGPDKTIAVYRIY